MAKFFGPIGFASSKPTSAPGVWAYDVVEKNYYGDITRTSRKVTGSGVIDDVEVTNTISIIADPYLNDHFMDIRYVTWNGIKWKVRSVDVAFPRLNLSLGSVWNGET